MEALLYKSDRKFTVGDPYGEEIRIVRISCLYVRTCTHTHTHTDTLAGILSVFQDILLED